MAFRRFLALAALAAVLGAGAATPGPGTHYASDAYPGFDDVSKILPQEKKSPSVFWWRKAKCTDPASQLALADKYVAEGSYGAAATQLNALVAEWPSTDEAALAQSRLAELLLEKTGDFGQAYEEYKYLADFYSSRYDYDKAVAGMYAAACKMREEGKRIVFFRFSNSVDVRRAFEDAVRHASGADFAPDAMVAIAELREEEGELPEAIAVYKTIRNRYPASGVVNKVLIREVKLRMKLFREHGYNRARALETLSFIDMAVKKMRLSQAKGALKVADVFEKCREEVAKALEDEAYKAAVFYDSRTRTHRSAVNAYENFLRSYPASEYAEDVRRRLEVLKGTNK